MADFRKHARKQDDSLAGLTARALARSATPASGCPDASIVAAYLERSLSDAEAAQHEQHFATCARCQQQLAVLTRLETSTPVSAADPSQASDRRWRRRWNWRIWAPAAAALGALALWIAGTSNMSERAFAPAAQTEIAENRAPQPAASTPQRAPSESIGLSADALSRAPAAKPSIAESPDAKKGALADRAKRDESITVVGRANQTPATPPPPLVTAAPTPSKEIPVEEHAIVAKTETADAAKLRDAEQKKKAAADTVAPQVAAATAEPERAQAQTRSRASQEQALTKEKAAREGDVATFRAGARAPAGLLMSGYTAIHAPAPSLALWRIGPGSTLEKSLDSGKTWQSQTLPTRVALQAGSAASEKICWLVGLAGAILRTTDGATWEKLPAPAATDLVAVEARDAENATVVAADGRRFLTSDAGRTWQLLK